MGNSLRCCLACVLPCGALDVIRIVHLNGHVEELTRSISAGEVLKANPNHVISKPCSQGVVRRILILSPESELKRGNIYFLIPTSSLPDKKRGRKKSSSSSTKKTKINSTTTTAAAATTTTTTTTTTEEETTTTTKVLDCDRYLAEMLSSENIKKSTSSSRRDRRSRVVVWKPYLDSITEDDL